MLCEIINPSDEVFMEHDDTKALFMAVVLLGRGQYGLKEVDGDFEVPLFLFGGIEEYCKEKFGINFTLVSNAVKGVDLIAALRSVRMNHERTSMNDIVKSARSYADVLEKKALEESDPRYRGESDEMIGAKTADEVT